MTLSPGTTLEFSQNTGLLVDTGQLVADASEGDPIRFIATNGETLAGYWKGIGYTSSFSTSNVLRNVEIAHAGSSGWDGSGDSRASIFLERSRLEIERDAAGCHHHQERLVRHLGA